MSEIMAHQQWMHLTHGGLASVRSKELKAVDDALAKFQKTKSSSDKEALAASLLKWMQAKGSGWKTSVRNKNKGVEILYAQLTGTGGAQLSGRERVALSHVRDESRAIVHDLFFSKSLVWRKGFTAKLGNAKWGVRINTPGAAKNARTLANGAKAGGGDPSKATQLAQELIHSVVPAEILPDVLSGLAGVLPDFMKELAASLTPFVGVIVSGAGAAWNGKNVLRGQWRIEWAHHHISGSLAGREPAGALQAVIRILERERNQDLFSASVSIGEFCSKLAGVLADGGTATTVAVGLAANLAKLLSIIRAVIRDVLEKNAANRKMQRRVDGTIFETCPIVGAYLVCCAPTSVMVNTIFDERFGEIGWQSEVESAVKRHLVPLKEHARRAVEESRFWIPELYYHQGIRQKNKQMLKEMLKRKGKTGMDAIGSDSMAPADLILAD